MFTSIDHFAFVVRDADASRDFYCQHLGFTVDREKEAPSPHLKKICFIRLGDTLLELLQLTPNPVGDVSAIAGCHLCLATTDFDAAVQTLAQAGLQILQHPVTAGGGRRRAGFAGPDGEEIELTG